uniref:Uncharacterized protein n=1 Tax=Sicyonia whispovirus TaxID=2984283 RepID=A0A9C7F7B8_9VIRU|nr:MAG: hypothetical protein [Sicyonia whispovirus]
MSSGVAQPAIRGPERSPRKPKAGAPPYQEEIDAGYFSGSSPTGESPREAVHPVSVGRSSVITTAVGLSRARPHRRPSYGTTSGNARRRGRLSAQEIETRIEAAFAETGARGPSPGELNFIINFINGGPMTRAEAKRCLLSLGKGL